MLDNHIVKKLKLNNFKMDIVENLLKTKRLKTQNLTFNFHLAEPKAHSRRRCFDCYKTFWRIHRFAYVTKRAKQTQNVVNLIVQ